MSLLAPVLLLLAVPCALALRTWRAPSRTLTILRAAVATLVVLALAQPVLELSRRGGTVVVVADRSASLPPAERDAQAALIRGIGSARSGAERLGVVSFAARPAVEQPPQAASFGGFTAAHDDGASDLHAALVMALAQIEPGRPGRIVVLSDGRATGTDPREAAALAAARGIAVDYRLQTRPTAGDLAVTRVDAPQEAAPGGTVAATAWISAPEAMEVDYSFRAGRTLLAAGRRRVPRGLSPLAFRDIAGSSGVRRYRVEVKAADGAKDVCPENNAAAFLVRVAGTRPLLCFPAAAGSRLPELLAGGGTAVEVGDPRTFDGALAALAGYSGVVIENRRADDFGGGTLRNIAAWVEHGGGGLLMTGGRNAFGTGGYYKSPLEPVMPVTMELRREHRKYSLAIAVVMDRSGSMMMTIPSGHTKMQMADRGAWEVVSLLSDADEVAVVAVDSAPHVVVGRQSVAAARRAEGTILGIESMGGGIFIYEGLRAGLQELAGSKAGVRHLLLFADASDSEEPGAYQKLLKTAADAGITVSVVGMGSEKDCDAGLLKDIATRGGGECFFSENADEIPRLFAQDTFLVARSTWITNATPVLVTAETRRLSDTLPAKLPPVGGYNLCYPHPEATVALATADENGAPLVALRATGSGRSIAFTGEADGAESGAFARGPHAGEFYAALGRACAGAREHARSGFMPCLRPAPGGARLVAYADGTKAAAAVDGLVARIVRQRPGGVPEHGEARLAWDSADALSAFVPVRGDETLLATVMLPDGTFETLPPYCLPHSAEYDAPERPEEGEETLADLAEATGGTRLAAPGEVWSLMPKTRIPFPLAPGLYLLAAAVFLLEVVERRTGILSARFARARRTAEPAGPEPDEAAAPARASAGHDMPQKTPPPVPGPAAPVPTAPKPDPFARAKRRAQNRE